MMSPDLNPVEASTNALLLPVGSYFWRSWLCKNDKTPCPFLFLGSGSKTGDDAETMFLTPLKTPRAVTGAASLTKLTSPNMVVEYEENGPNFLLEYGYMQDDRFTR